MNEHTLKKLQELVRANALSAHDGKIVKLYEAVLYGRKKLAAHDVRRLIHAANAVLINGQAARSGNPPPAPRPAAKKLPAKKGAKKTQKKGPPESVKRVLHVLDQAQPLLQAQEITMVENYRAVVMGQKHMNPNDFAQLQEGVKAIFDSVKGEVVGESKSFEEASADEHVAVSPLEKIERLRAGSPLLADEDDIAYVEGLGMAKDMDELQLTPEVKTRIDELYKCLVHREQLSTE